MGARSGQPLRVGSSDLLRRIIASTKKPEDTPQQPNKATNYKGQTKESHQEHLAKKQCNKTANAHCLPAWTYEVPREIHPIDHDSDDTNKLDGISNEIIIAILAPVISAFGDAAHFGFCALTNSVYLPRRDASRGPRTQTRRINLVGLKRRPG